VDFHHLLFAGFYRRTGLQELCTTRGRLTGAAVLPVAGYGFGLP
jgi:hypothetical protein